MAAAAVPATPGGTGARCRSASRGWRARWTSLYPGYFTFSFVRNPCRRCLSPYRHASRYAEIRAPHIPNHPPTNGTLREFAERRYGPPAIPLRHLKCAFGHARPQTRFLAACNGQPLFGWKRRSPGPPDFIGAVESIEADCRRVQEALGLPRRPQEPACLKGMTARCPA